MRLPRLSLIFLCVCVAGLSRAASPDDPVDTPVRPALAEMMALSPDGRRIAYTSRAGGDLAVVIMNLDASGQKRTVPVDAAHDPALPGQQPPTQLRFLRWAGPSRLVFAPVERAMPLPPIKDRWGRSIPNPDGPIIVSPIMFVDLESKQRGTLVDAHDFLETPQDVWRTPADLLMTPLELAAARKEPVRWRMPHLDILGFLPGNREQLIIATHGAYNAPRQHTIDLRTGAVSMFGGNWPSPPGESQVFDWHRLKVVGERRRGDLPTTVWHDDELARVQRELETKFPRRAVEIVDWSETRARFVVRVTGGSDSGRVFVFERLEDLAVEILRCGPAAPPATARFINRPSPVTSRTPPNPQ